MGYKNRTHRQKRVISERKFTRVFISNLDKSGVAYRTIKYETQRSLAAVMVDGIIYAKFTYSSGNTIYIRYLVKEPSDFIAFIPYCSELQAIIDIDNIEVY